MKNTQLLWASASLCVAIQTAHAEERIINFNIPAQSAANALDALALQSDLQMLFNRESLKNSVTPSLVGQYTARQALQKLLAGSGLTYTFTANDAVAVKVADSGGDTASALPAVKVIGKSQFSYFDGEDPYNTDYARTNAITATKTDTPLMQTPMSVKVVPQQVLKDQQAITVPQALNNVSGAITNEGADGAYFLRGFQNFNYYRDGFLNQSQWFHTEDLANIERVEVLKGPGSLLYGRTEPGGLVNFVTKKPLDQAYYSVRQQFGSFDLYRTDIDATGPITANKDLAYRLNFAYQANNSFQEFAGNERILVSPSFRWNISDKTTSLFRVEYSDIKETGRGNIPLMGNKPAPIPRSRNLGDPWNFQEDKYVMVSLNTEHAFNNHWKLQHRFNFTNYQYSGSSFGVDGNWSTVQANGDQTRSFFGQNIDGEDYQRNYFNALELTGKFDTGFAKHTVLLGGDYYRADVRVTMAGFGANPNQYDTTNIYNPTHQPGVPDITAADITTYNWALPWWGVYAQDQIELPYHFHVMGGLRYDSAEYDDTAVGEYGHDPIYSDEDRVSPRGGIVWQPIPELSFFGSYTENFGASNTSNTGTPLPPQTAQQWETGIKTELFDGRLTGSIAYFDLTKQSIPVAVRPGVTEAAGEQQSKGVEFDVSGEVLPGWNVIAGYAWTPFAKTTVDAFNGNRLGKRLHNAPEQSANLWSTYEFQTGDLQGLKFGAGVRVVGERQIGYDETAYANGYTTVNLMGSKSWHIGPTRLTAQLNIDNLLDKTYTSTVYSYGPSYYGAPRTFLGSIKVEY
jgi:iron complex outermembrane receptor protein